MTLEIKSLSKERLLKSKIPRNIKFKLVNLICNKHIGKFLKLLNIKSNLFGGYFNYDLVSDREAAKIFFGIWESAEIRLAKRNIECNTVIELGTSVGVMLGVLSRVKKLEKYICVEANPYNFEILNKFIDDIPTDSHIKTYHNAIHYGSEFINLNLNATQSSSIYKKSHNSKNYNIKTITLSELLRKEDINKEFALVTDIEGSEADIFFEDSNSLDLCNEIICELDSTNRFTVESQFKRILEIGFECLERYNNVFYFKKLKI